MNRNFFYDCWFSHSPPTPVLSVRGEQNACDKAVVQSIHRVTQNFKQINYEIKKVQPINATDCMVKALS